MIVFAGIVPCSPLLIESVNPEKIHQAEKTRAALGELAEELFAAQPDTIVIFCEHTKALDSSFSINVADPYRARLTNFGDLGYLKTYPTDFMLADGIQRQMRHNHQPITLITETDLPFTATVPLSFLCEHLPKIHILPIAPSSRSPKEHFDFGAALQESLAASTKRIAIIAAGDCSHTESKEFEDLLYTLIVEKNTSGLLQIPDEVRNVANDACYRQIVMLFGVLDSMPVTTRVLSHEAPFGVGQIVAEFILK